MKIALATDFGKLHEQDMLVLIQAGSPSALDAFPDVVREEFEKFCSDAEKKRVKEPRAFLLRENELRIRLYMTSTAFSKGLPEAEKAKVLAATALSSARKQGESRIAVCLPKDKPEEWASWLTEGLELGAYQFTKYKSKKEEKAPEQKITFLLSDASAKKKVQEAITQTQIVTDAVNAAREIVNIPGSDFTPEDFARHARQVAKANGISCEVLDDKELAKQCCSGLLFVGKGSAHPPRMVILRYEPPKAPKNKRLCLIGKGITFDTGGLNIKTGGGFGMWTMKSDMGGAAAVLHAMEAIAKKKISLNVIAIMGLAENAVDAHSVLPGDIFKARNGKTVQVENTDAEGRLTLTDSLYRAGEEKATHIIDVATLTGACVRALGTSMSGLFCNDEELGKKIEEAGRASGEDLWQLPMYEEYREMLKTPAADFSNISSSPNGGAITAALFISEFVPKNTPWAHIDIAGPSFYEKKWRYLEAGASGVMVRTLTRLAENF